jgi:formylglycine-generating enzyme required for sulfatase activity
VLAAISAGVSGTASGGSSAPTAAASAASGESDAPPVRSETAEPSTAPSACPDDMAAVDASFCIDRYEASLVEVVARGEERPWPYYAVVPPDVDVRAVSLRSVFPQGYISGVRARAACERSGKRLCRPYEWRVACRGPSWTTFPYGDARVRGRCNDDGRSPMHVFHPEVELPGHGWMWGFAGNMIDPRLNQLEGTLSRTGERSACTNAYGVFDMVGNLHEWVEDPDGTFQGGYYLDTRINGDGCNYRTTFHPMGYRDYSIGFRCCADIGLDASP